MLTILLFMIVFLFLLEAFCGGNCSFIDTGGFLLSLIITVIFTVLLNFFICLLLSNTYAIDTKYELAPISGQNFTLRDSSDNVIFSIKKEIDGIMQKENHFTSEIHYAYIKTPFALNRVNYWDVKGRWWLVIPIFFPLKELEQWILYIPLEEKVSDNGLKLIS